MIFLVVAANDVVVTMVIGWIVGYYHYLIQIRSFFLILWCYYLRVVFMTGGGMRIMLMTINMLF